MPLRNVVERLKDVLIPSGTVTERAVKSGAWGGATNTVNRLIQLVKVGILANLIPPAEFGLLGIGFLVLAVFRHFSELGFNAALIQHEQERIDEYLNTAWTLEIGRGLLIALIAYLLAPHAATFFSEPRVTPVIRVLGLSPLILGFGNPGIVYFKKDLKYHRRFAQLVSGTMVNFVVAVSFGFLLQNVWALVFGTIAGNVTSLVASYFLHGYRPRPGFKPALAREMVNYGKWIFGTTGLHFLVDQGDDAFIGWFLGATSLGYYQMAYRFSNAPATEITQVISSVLFPTYSQVQTDVSKLRKGFFRTLRLSTFISFPAATGIIAVAPVFVPAFLGSNWLPIIPVMQVLAAWGLLRSLTGAMGPLFPALGRPDISTKLKAGQLAVIAVLIYPATDQFGIVGAGGVIVLSGLLVKVPITSYLGVRFVDGTFRRYFGTLIFPTVGSTLMAIGIWYFGQSVTISNLFLDFVLQVAVGIAIYSLLTGIAIAVFNYDVQRDFRTIYESFV